MPDQSPDTYPKQRYEIDNLPMLELVPKVISSQAIVIDVGNRQEVEATSLDGTALQFVLLRDGELNENFSHKWEEADLSSFVDTAQQFIQKGQTIANVYKQGAGAIGRKTAWTKVDAGLIYKGSERRQYTFRVGLVTQTDPWADVLKPIRILQKFSCAEDIDGGALPFTISAPAIFRISIEPSKFIYVENAALTDIQVNYNTNFHFGLPGKGAEMSGVPKTAELSLTFIDLNPLYRRSVGSMDEKVVTVGGK